MAPSRFQCLNVATRMAKKGFKARAGFSTSQTRRADDPPNSSSIDDMLTSINNSSRTASGISPTIAQAESAAQADPEPSQTEPLSASDAAPPQNPITLKATDAGSQSIINLFKEAQAKNIAAHKALTEKAKVTLKEHFHAEDYSKLITRRWRAGDVYAPHDLSGVEMRKWKARQKPTQDMFDVLNFNPEEHYRNFNIMSEFMTPMGRIKHSSETGLRPVNQRRIARAIRRSIGIGMMPSVHRHPEILYREREKSDRVPDRYKRTSGATAPL